MEKVKGLLKKSKVMALALMVTLLTAPAAFATSDATTAIVSSAEGINTDFAATAAGVGPVAVKIIGIFIVWKLGIKFFTSLTSKS